MLFRSSAENHNVTIDSDVQLTPFTNVKLKTWWEKAFAWWNTSAWWLKLIIGALVIAILFVLAICTSGCISVLYGTMFCGAV